MLFSHQPLLNNAELPVEHGLREMLAPGAAQTQGAGNIQGKFLGRQLAVGVYDRLQLYILRVALKFGNKCLGKLRIRVTRQTEPGGHGMAAKFTD